MKNVVVRDIPENVIERLTERAARNHRTLDQELREILTDAVRLDLQSFIREAERIRRSVKPAPVFDVTAAIREDRDR